MALKRLAVLITLALAAVTVQAKNMYIPAAAKTPGVNGTYFRTDVRIFNPSSEFDIDVTLHFLPQGEDGRNISGQLFSIGKRQTLVLDDVVAQLAPALQQVVGAIRIDSDTNASYSFVASSRTYTESGDPARPGSYGQFIPALEPAQALRSAVLLHVSSRPQFRTNAGVMNPGSGPATIRMKLLGTDGNYVLESLVMEVPPMSMRQWSLPELFGGVFLENGTIAIESTLPVFSWASVIDNYSGDSIYVPGIDDSAEVTPLSGQ